VPGVVDFVVIGSGFGGSVSALRLAEKGYSVTVLEMGKRWEKEDFPSTNWNLRRFLWRPALGLHGILQMTLVKDAFFLHGCGVGGGSLVYANTLLVPPPEVFTDPRWMGLDWQKELAPHYATALHMLGAVKSPVLSPSDKLLREIATEMGRGDTFHEHTVGVFFGKPGEEIADPYFDGEGPARTGCTMCGGCMVGCRVGAKNTLDRNYLYLAEKRGVTVEPESRVVDIRPVTDDDGHGYELLIERSTGWFRTRRTLRARQVVVSAGSVGTAELLLRCQQRGSLAKLSAMLGGYLRTNSEALLAVRARNDAVDHSKGIAITSGAYLDERTHVEIVRYPSGSDAMAFLSTVLTDDGPGVPRPLRWLGNVLRRPFDFLRSLNPVGFAKRGAILLVMQPIDSHLRYVLRRRWYWPFGKTLDSAPALGFSAEQAKVPVYLPLANEAARRLAVKMDGDARSGILEVLTGRATTAHVFGGCPIGRDAAEGVVDPYGRAFGYEGLYVVDGSILPANLGVNPSLTITAMAEHVMKHVPDKATSRATRAD
jgi:cholesterol oxidase